MVLTFEDIIDQIGGMGRFQIMMILIVVGSKFPMAWGMLLMTFGGKIPDWWCVNEAKNRTLTDIGIINRTFQSCKRNGTSCDHFQYGGEMRTVIEEFDLICDRKQLTSLTITIQLTGTLIFSPLTGQCADLIGRKKTLIMLLIIHIIFCIVSIFSYNWAMFTVIRFMIGGAVGGITVLDTPVPIEFTGRRWRAYVPGLPSWAVGAIFFALAAYLLNDWKYLSIASAVVTLPFLIGTMFIPESMRWLLVHGRRDKAKQVVERIARINKKPCPELTKIDELAETIITEGTDKSYTMLDLFRTRQMAKQTLVLAYMWFSFGLTFYGVTFGVINLSGNFYINLFLSGLVEVPGPLMSIYFTNRVGRRCTICVSALLCSLSAAAIVPVSFMEPTKGALVISGLAMASKFFCNMSWMASKLHASEINPTVVRALALASACMVSRVGALIAPQLIYLDQMNGSLMYLLIAVTTFVTTGFVWSLPESNNSGIPDTIEYVVKTGQLTEEKKEKARGIFT